MHRSHLFVDGVYGCVCLSILQVVSNGVFWSFSFQMCLLSSVLFPFSLLVKVALWAVYRVLKVLAVSPMYLILAVVGCCDCGFVYNILCGAKKKKKKIALN